ncbi:MAG: leucine-rich repeat domain-containing protein [Clostridia bacterium]|nr:leucine-rich repeat domain-containing protein [Clostridia bacterium]
MKIPEGITEIGEAVFARHEEIRKISFPFSLQKISWKAFEYCTGIKEIEIPQAVKRIEEFAFSHCEMLENIWIRGENTILEKDALIACENFNIIAPEKDISEFPAFYRIMSVFGYAYATETLNVSYSPVSERSHLEFLKENQELFLPFTNKRTELYFCIRKHFPQMLIF